MLEVTNQRFFNIFGEISMSDENLKNSLNGTSNILNAAKNIIGANNNPNGSGGNSQVPPVVFAIPVIVILILFGVISKSCSMGDCEDGDMAACKDACRRGEIQACIKSCDSGDTDSCKEACKKGDANSCPKACQGGDTFTCRKLCDGGNAEACQKLCNDGDNGTCRKLCDGGNNDVCKKMCDNGDSGACKKSCDNGDGKACEKVCDSALIFVDVEACQKACDNGNPKYCAKVDVMACNKGDAKACQKACDNGDAKACEKVSKHKKDIAIDIKAKDFSLGALNKDPVGFREKYVGQRIRTRGTLTYIRKFDGLTQRVYFGGKSMLVFNDTGDDGFGCILAEYPDLNVKIGDSVVIEGKGKLLSDSSEEEMVAIPLLSECKIISK